MKCADPGIEFSVIIPSLQRIHRLENLLESFLRTTTNLSIVEFIICLDFTDPTLLKYFELLNRYQEKMKIFVIVRQHNDNLNDGYYNLMANMSNGQYIWAVNDDSQIMTINWDGMVLDKLNEKGIKNKLYYLKIGGNGTADGDGSFSAFPMVHRTIMTSLGYFHFPRIKSWDADEVLWNVMLGLRNRHGYDRVVGFTEIHANHLNMENPRAMKYGEGIDAAQNNMIKNYVGSEEGKDFQHYTELCLRLKRGVELEAA